MTPCYFEHVCSATDPEALLVYKRAVERHRLVEWEAPDAEAVPEGQAEDVPLTLAQFIGRVRERYGTGVRVLLRPRDGERPVVWLALQHQGEIWLGDATVLVEQLAPQIEESGPASSPSKQGSHGSSTSHPA